MLCCSFIFFVPSFIALFIMPSLFSWILWKTSLSLIFSWRFGWSLFCLFRVRREFLRNRRCKRFNQKLMNSEKIWEGSATTSTRNDGTVEKHKVNPGAALYQFYCSFRFLLRSSSSYEMDFCPTVHISSIPSFLSGFTFSDINYNFLWLHLNDPDPLYILPVIIGALQFFRCFSWSDARKTKSRKRKSNRTITTRNDDEHDDLHSSGSGGRFLSQRCLPLGLYRGISTAFCNLFNKNC